MWTRVLMRLMADFARETFENEHGFAGRFRRARVCIEGNVGTQVLCHEVFLADFVPDTFENPE